MLGYRRDCLREASMSRSEERKRSKACKPLLKICESTLAVVIAAAAFSGARADGVMLAPSKDNTLYQTVDGSLSNGVGRYVFAGETAVGTLRRAVMEFDIACNIPAGAT